jgi:hypothetical protein
VSFHLGEDGQLDPEDGLVLLAIDGDGPAVGLDQGPGDVEPRPSPLLVARARKGSKIRGRSSGGMAPRFVTSAQTTSAPQPVRTVIGVWGSPCSTAFTSRFWKTWVMRARSQLPSHPPWASTRISRSGRASLISAITSEAISRSWQLSGRSGMAPVLAPGEVEQVADQLVHPQGARGDAGRRSPGDVGDIVPSGQGVGGQRDRLHGVSKIVAERADEQRPFLLGQLALGDVEEADHRPR